MRVKFQLNGTEKLRNFISLVQLFGKHGNTVYFVFREGSLTILLDQRNPLIWVELNMKLFAQSYLFENNDEDTDDKEVVYVEFSIKDLLLGLKFFQKDADVAKIKLIKDKFPLLRINAQMDSDLESSPKYRTEIPAIIVPKEKWTEFPVPTDLQFEIVMKSPRFRILRKYVDIFKNFKYIHFTFRNNALQLRSDEIGSTVSTTFDKCTYVEGSAKEKGDVILDVRKLLLYFASITSVHSLKIHNLTLSMTHQKMMKMSFQNEQKSILFNYVMASKTDEEEDDDEEISDKENYDENEL